MGDRVQRTRPGKAEECKVKCQKRDETQYDFTRMKGVALLSEGVKEMESLGDQPRDILCGAADEVLAVLNNDKLKDREKKKETELLIGLLAEERFALLVSLGKKITDFGNEKTKSAATGEENIDKMFRINVQFEESEEDDDEDMYGKLREEMDDEEGKEAKEDIAIHAENLNPY